MLVTVLISYLLYREGNKYEFSDDSKVYLFYLIFPFLKKYMREAYITGSLAMFLLYFNVFTVSIVSVMIFAIILVLQMIIFIDVKCFRLPNVYVLPLIPISLIVSSFHIGFVQSFLGGLTAFIIVFLLGIVRIGGLGGGDLKFAVVLGMLLGLNHIVLALCLMFVLGGLFSFLFYSQRIIGRKDYIPYGPFLFLGFVVSFIWFYS